MTRRGALLHLPARRYAPRFRILMPVAVFVAIAGCKQPEPRKCKPCPAPQAPETEKPRERPRPAQQFTGTTVKAPAAFDKAKLKGVTAAIAKRASTLVTQGHYPGLIVGIVSRKGLVWWKAFGVDDPKRKKPLTPDTVFRIGSVSKTFTGAALLLLRDEGKLGLDDPVVSHVPELKLVYPTRDSPRVTIRHLVTHTSGIPRLGSLDYMRRPEQGPTDAEIIKALDGVKLKTAPGVRAAYSNLGTALACLVVARVSGIPFAKFVSQKILGPLGMKSTVWEQRDVSAARLATGRFKHAGKWQQSWHWRFGSAGGIGGLYSTLQDMSRYVAMNLSAWPPGSHPDKGPIRRASLRESHRPGGHVAPTGTMFGINWEIRTRRALGTIVGHNGATLQYSATVRMLLSHGVGVIALGNTGVFSQPHLEALAELALKQVHGALRPKLTPQLKAGRKWLLKLLADATPKTLEAALTSGFRKAVPLALIKNMFAPHRLLRGCAKPELLPGARAHRGVFLIECENGSVKTWVSVSKKPPHRINGIKMM